MKKITFLFLFIGILFSPKVFSQCTDFSGGGPWTDFNGTFGGAPCDAGSGCPFNEINAFEIWADESYLMDGIVAGSTYTFSACNGTGGTAWNISYTVIAPSGAVDAFGLDGGSICAITWTATESGTYEIGISEAGIPCDTSTNTSTDNGFPAITCSSGTPCPIAPDPVTLTSPMNMETGVVIDNTDAANNIVSFTWDDAATGGAPTSYQFYLGLTSTGDDIGNLNTPNNGVNLIYSWAYNTTYYWKVEAINGSGTSLPSPVFSFTTGSCTAIANPAATSGPMPANAATNVPILTGGEVSFNWTAGDPNDLFVLTIGTANPPDVVFNNFENGSSLTGLATNTTYFWTVEAVNCFGRTAGPVWSFTTDTTMSISDNDLANISVVPNPTSGVLNIKSSMAVEHVEFFNLLGQSVASFSKNQIHDNSVDISEFVNGLYLAKITIGDKTQTIRVIKE